MFHHYLYERVERGRTRGTSNVGPTMTWFESFAFAFGSIVCRSCMAVLDGSNSSTGDIDFVTVERRFDGYLRNILQGCVEESLVVGRGFPWYYR